MQLRPPEPGFKVDLIVCREVAVPEATLAARFPNTPFTIFGSYTTDKPEEFCAKRAQVHWADGPSSDEVYATTQSLPIEIICLHYRICSSCGAQTMARPPAPCPFCGYRAS